LKIFLNKLGLVQAGVAAVVMTLTVTVPCLPVWVLVDTWLLTTWTAGAVMRAAEADVEPEAVAVAEAEPVLDAEPVDLACLWW